MLGRGCVSQICVRKQLVETWREKKKELYKDFMDLMKSYDGVCKRNYREYYKIEELKNT